MKNQDRYKTSLERTQVFDKFCKSNTTDKGLCMPDCKLFHAQDESKDYCCHCEFHWLDLEAEEEKPLPCPFCGDSCYSTKRELGGYVVSCSNGGCNYCSGEYDTESDAIAAHNRVAKAVRESEGK